MPHQAPAQPQPGRDHGGGLDAAIARHGGTRGQWLDLSTGINPVPYPLPPVAAADWTALPDRAAQTALTDAARAFWPVPGGAGVLAAPGASALIARLPALAPPGRVRIDAPTYNEHAAGFAAMGWSVVAGDPAEARVLVQPNNPDGRLRYAQEADAPLTIIDESFCDICPEQSLIALADRPGVVVLKSFGKFWGLAGLRLGFAIAAPQTIARLAELLGPWPVSGPAMRIGAAALRDGRWAEETRARLARDAVRLDALMIARGAALAGGTDLFRLYRVADAAAWQDRLARQHIWTRVFPYSSQLLRLGLPAAGGWDRLETAL
ncbi:threonine-phosphate decarboxylase [Antarcticimicrobium luteum]|uniref:Aminotransferase n=1 Tax=Antarcticimicrobium luteum TaxID=2547397 RepID=A0A4R5V4C3_9RHOB|nr:threonine-phosphate decarboxylase [Antarcticimicrobium luteum]TDK46763.1 pyridoxal phosphate-dependent class II aminotransferase [Antarcticimicrobium luteum]